MSEEKKKIIPSWLRTILVLTLVIFGYWRVFVFLNELGFEKQYDKKFTSPNKVNTILVRYDYVSRPSVFLDGKEIFEYSRAGFMENVHFDVKWISDYEFILYNERVKEEYRVVIPK